MRELFAAYRDRVYALDHPTLSRSPIGNALALAQALPAGARLHLLTHSRGGLVAEVLARACGGAGLSAAELALFPGEGYAVHRRELQQLFQLARQKALRVERVVRVACPAHGTLLASRRLDAYLSVLEWGLELAGVPVLPQLVDFLQEVARRRARPEQLPGLEAMLPESPLVRWLTRQQQPIPGELRVIAGDLEGDSVVSWVKTLLADAYYWTDNDLVVQTRAMYGGVARQAAGAGAAAHFVLDRGGRVSHFNYFSNESSVKAIAQALLQAQPPGFAPIGPLSWSGESAEGVRAAQAVRRSRGGSDADRAARPAVVVLPGILGSHLKLDGRRVWLGLGFVNALQQLAWDPATAHRVEPDGPIGASYGELIAHLADTHEVIPFAYDWRRPIEDEARRLATVVDAALAAREASGGPVRLLAHSMGGIVARTLQLEAPDTWRRLMARAGARIVMLGTPNGGSWAPMQTLSGDDSFGNALAAFGSLFDNAGARRVMAAMPGFLQLQAGLLDPALGLDRSEGWDRLAREDIRVLLERNAWHDREAQEAVYCWSAPPQPVLDAAMALRRRLDAQLPELARDAQRICLVVGQARFTPDGFALGPRGLEYLAAVEGGDGRVTLAGVLLPGVPAWQVAEEHGALANRAEAFAGYVDLLEHGTTLQLAPLRRDDPSGRPEEAAVMRAPLRPSRMPQAWQPPATPADLLAPPRPEEPAIPGAATLRLGVVNGDLQFIREPLLIGHYVSLRLTGAEAAVDRMVGGGLSRAMAAGLYPDEPATHKVFGNEGADPGPAAVVVVGLGEEGKLRSHDLIATVRQGVLACAQQLSEREGGSPVRFAIAATLIGSGGSGVTVAQAAQCIAQGVREALRRIGELNAPEPGRRWPEPDRLDLVELYLDRATEAWRALQQLEHAEEGAFRLDREVRFLPGASRRTLDANYRGVGYDIVSALSVPGTQAGERCIQFRLDTRRARTEVTGLRAQDRLLDQLVAKASNEPGADPMIGRTLFNLLVPVEIEAFLAGRDEVVLELDEQTARLPWELLDTDAARPMASAGPWAVRTRMVRKLRVPGPPPRRRDAQADDAVLVVGEPACDPQLYPPLPGARREALAVRDLLAARLQPGQLRELVRQDSAATILQTLFERPWRLVHVAGHGVPATPDAPGGVVLSDGIFLGPHEVAAMRTVPELVFLNCCHLAAWPAQEAGWRYDRARFAAGIAQALIEVGVRCVVAAGWAVDDRAAQDFATAFYAALLAGRGFSDAVGAAREAAWSAHPGDATWAAYQCYGDPGWRWRDATADAQAPLPSLGGLERAIASPADLCLALDNLAGDLAFRRFDRRRADDAVRHLEAEYAPRWGDIGLVAESFALVHAVSGREAKAIAWYERAVRAPDGSASLRAVQQLKALKHRGVGTSARPTRTTRPPA
ncbi:MAG TPA: CHAT domain-containing protein [Ramlibacter sp.]|nr:CHAT domain-containing protein [Ramlibacter sp.]